MRIDHHAYQRATRVAAFGLLIQVIVGVTLLIFGMVSADTTFQFASVYVGLGVLVWLALIVIFHQHKLERLESLEEDELAASRAGTSSVFDASAEESRVAARRLRLMHKWLMPLVSLVYALLLAVVAYTQWKHLRHIEKPGDSPAIFAMTLQLGWAVAITLAFAVVSFIFSRFVAGMAKQQVWQNLRGGAGHMVGNALVMLAVAIGIIFRFFDKSGVMWGVAYAIPIYMGIVAIEIILNFILNLYRPRVPGEVPRPAFDSKLLSLLATPDSIVRSINEAVNYQFGFDVTSSWGYQLLIRSFAGLVALGLVTLVVLDTMVVVEPHQQAVRLRGGKLIGDVHGSGIMWKWPWPVETAQVYDVSRIRDLHLTARQLRESPVRLWTDEVEKNTDVEIEPFLVGSSTRPAGSYSILRRGNELLSTPAAPATMPDAPDAPDIPGVTDAAKAAVDAAAAAEAPAPVDAATEAVSASYSLVDAEIILQYRIRQDGLLDYLGFASDAQARRQNLTNKERAIKSLALAQVSFHLSSQSLDDVLSPGRTRLIGDLRDRIQKSLDDHKTGVEVVAVNIPLLRPSGTSAQHFEEYGISVQAARQRLAETEREVEKGFAHWLGNPMLRDEVIAALEAYDQVRSGKNADPAEVGRRRQAVEQILHRGGGQASRMITDAERDRWVKLMQQRIESSRVQGELGAYRAAPNFYKQRMLMSVYTQLLPYKKKYIIGVDPTHLNVNMDLKELNPLLNPLDAVLTDEQESKK